MNLIPVLIYNYNHMSKNFMDGSDYYYYYYFHYHAIVVRSPLINHIFVYTTVLYNSPPLPALPAVPTLAEFIAFVAIVVVVVVTVP